VVVGFDPATNAAQTTIFRNLYGIPAAAQVFGPYDGKLGNSGENLNLYSPDRPQVAGTNIIVPYVLRDKLTYGQTSPWPSAADGDGASLQRVNSLRYGNDPTNWVALDPSAGLPNNAAPGKLQHVALDGSNAIVTAASFPGRTYTLQYRTDFASGTWTSQLPSVQATGVTVTFTNAGAPPTKRFYRVKVQ
jgi:hypothetical protein